MNTREFESSGFWTRWMRRCPGDMPSWRWKMSDWRSDILVRRTRDFAMPGSLHPHGSRIGMHGGRSPAGARCGRDYAAPDRHFGRFCRSRGVGSCLADNFIDLSKQSCSSTGGRASWTRADGTTESSMVKVAASESLWRIADRCVQILGLGVTRDHYRRTSVREMRAFRIYDGPSGVHRLSLRGGSARAQRRH